MGSRGFSPAGLAQLHDLMAGHVEAGHLPGAVFGLGRRHDIHIDAVGSAALDGSQPMPPDAVFRITSMTRPITALATLLLVQDAKLALDEPVDRLLPELAHRQVLRRLDGPLDGTVAAARPITVRDLLTFRGGFGMILAPPDEYPILQAEQALELCSVGPPTPPTPLGPDEWMRRMGTLPLMDQPGQQWRYHTGSQILGVLVARAAGQTAEAFYRERIFGPLGMEDTAFELPAPARHRLPPCYQDVDGHLEPFDDEGLWTRPRPFTDCGAGLLSTVSDYLTFGRMLLARGRHQGEQFISPELVAAMTTDHLTPEQRQTGGLILGGRGWGFGLSIIDAPEDPSRGPKGYGWSGGYGTVWLNDPDEDLVAVLCHQVLAWPSPVEADFWSATYQALEG
jgi:CubicO group peptidase (beta-lactamase class C family)